jgi:hypothetical protein
MSAREPIEPAESDTPTAVDHRSLPRPNAQQGIVHSEEAKALALSVYAETGSTQTAAHETGIPRTTIDNWVRRDPDIDSKLDALRQALRTEIAHRYAQVAIKATTELLDRLENGDELIDKEGNSYRRKVPAHDLAFIASVATDKHARLTGTMGKVNAEDQTLTRLAEKLVKAIDTTRRGNKAVDAAPHNELTE